jgi:hypothetical protein
MQFPVEVRWTPIAKRTDCASRLTRRIRGKYFQGLLEREMEDAVLIRTCRSDRKAGENQQLVVSDAKLLTPFSSPLSEGFAAICHNYYYISMTERHSQWIQNRVRFT